MAVYKEKGMVEFSLTWKIVNFSHCAQLKGQYLHSPDFVLDAMDEIKWQLQLYPRGERNGNFVALFLIRKKRSSKIVSTLDYEFEVILNDGSAKHVVSAQNRVFDEHPTGWGSWEFLSRDLLRKQKNNYLPQDTFTVRCRVWQKSTLVPKERQFFASTRIAVEMRNVVWTIPDFSTLDEHQERVFRAESTLSHYPTLYFKLKLGGETNDNVQIEISQVDAKKQNFSTCQIYAIDFKGNSINSVKSEYSFVKKTGRQTWNFPQFISKTKLTSGENALPGDVLFLRCMCTISIGSVTNEIDDHGPFLFETRSAFKNEFENKDVVGNSGSPARSFIYDLLNVYKDGFASDVFLKAEGETFPVHPKLCDRSPVFKAMFTTEMREKSTHTVDIPDIDANTLQRMLLFVYQDLLDDLECDDVSKLYFAADKYSILTLKEKCSSLLKAKVTTFNACQILTLADTHQDDDLKGVVQEFISSQDDEMFHSEEWKSLMQINLQLAAETMHKKLTKK